MDNCKTISLKDNQSYDKAYSLVYDDEASDEKKIPESYWEDIKHVSSISSLKGNSIITIPSKSRNKNNDIFSRVNDQLFTYNWVGVLSYRSKNEESEDNYRIEIRSRFDENDKQYFLLYLLCSVCGINVFDLSVNSQSESDYTAIMVLLFLMKLMEAYEDGIYKEYVRKRYNEYDFKGVMDINRHIKINNPFVGKTAYSTREYSYDNDILCLIRQALDYIKDYFPDILKGYLNNNVILNEIMDAIENATPSYRMNVNYADSMKCRREITHPMYQKYEDVRKLALMILQESGQNVFDDKEQDAFGILIDVSWLWEEFIAVKLLNEYGYLHMLTDNSKGSLQWADKEYWYPDYIESGKANSKRNVFDAKYKFWEWNKDADIHQLLSYLFLTGGDNCGIIYPSQEEQSAVEQKEINAFASFYDKKPKIYKLPLFIPQNEYDDYSEYCKKIDDSITAWKQSFSAKIASH